MNCGDVSIFLSALASAAMLLASSWQWRLMEFFTIGWFVVLGSCFGSFLNVVIYRVPLGMSLGKPDSHCPNCETPILLRDNIPILGWLKLRGNCRSCQVAISARYPIVESVVAAIFLVLLLFEVVSGGMTFPLRTTSLRAGVSSTIWEFHVDLLAIYAYHCFLFCVLLAGSLMVFDGHRIPWRLWGWTVGVAVIAPLFVTQLHPVPAVDSGWLSDVHIVFATWSNPLNILKEHSVGLWLVGPLTSLIGLTTGAALGWVWLFVVPSRWITDADRNACFFVVTVAGGFLGWQAVPSILLLATLVLLLIPVLLRNRIRTTPPIPWCGVVSCVVLIQVLAWEASTRLKVWPTHEGWRVLATPSAWEPICGLSLAFGVATGLMAITRWIDPLTVPE